jgi:NAD(P)-dependent dehydrogenase (short-subunit alcohol dehydrogenase family)
MAPASSLFDVAGRVVIVTGGGRGIGRVYCEHFAQAGMHVVAADIYPDDAERVALGIRKKGGKALALRTDISSEKETLAMAEAAAREFGGIDALVNNASMMSALARRPWDQIPLDEWDRVMAVDLRGLFLSCRAVVPHMKKRGKGKIVNISSGRVLEGTPNRLHYTTAKAGVIGFTRALARELGGEKINVNVVLPGLTLSDTQVASSQAAYLSSNDMKARALGRPQYPEDLVGTVLYLLSDASDYVTGQSFNVDGGKVMH